MANIKNAPHLKQQKDEPLHALTILAGSQAWEAFGGGNGQEWIFLCEAIKADRQQPPIVLGDKQLAEISQLRIAPQNRQVVDIYQFGNLSESHKTAICLNLAKLTDARTVVFHDNIGQVLENASDYIARLRQDSTLAEQVVESSKTDEQRKAEFTALFKEMGDNEKLAEFLKWYEKPLRINDLSKAIYHYTGKKWEIVEDSQMGRNFLSFFKAKGVSRYSANNIKNLLELLKYESEPMSKADPHLLAFANGVLHKQTGDFMPHDERHFLTSFINIDYYSTQTATPNFDKWLNWVSDSNEEKKQRILAALYMILTNRHEWQLFLEITGAGGTGKSVFNHLARILAGGDDNTASISLKDLENPTMRCGLIDKTLCYSPDQESYISDGGILRSITGGDSISFRPLYRGAFQDTVKAVFLITGNSPIIFKEQKGGTSRRRVIFQFNKVVREEEKDFELPQKLEQEAGGIVRLLLDAFPDPIVAKQLLEAQKHSEEALEVKEENDHILQFAKHFEAREIINGLTLGSSRRPDAHRTALHSAYLYYCERMGIPNPLQRNRFRQAFEYALKERGSKLPLRTRIKDGINVTNIYYANMIHSLNEWND